MEFIKNIDDCFRISLIDLKFELNLKPNNAFRIDYNELTKQITLTLIENASELNLVANKNTLEVCSNSTDLTSTFWENGVLKHKIQAKPKSINEFFNLKPEDVITKEKIEQKMYDNTSKYSIGEQNVCNNEPIQPIFKDSDIISFRTPNEIIYNLECYYCNKIIEPNCFVKVNNKYLCNNCLKLLKNQLLIDSKKFIN